MIINNNKRLGSLLSPWSHLQGNKIAIREKVAMLIDIANRCPKMPPLEGNIIKQNWGTISVIGSIGYKHAIGFGNI